MSPDCTVIGNMLFVAKCGWQSAQILKFQTADAARDYARLTGMNRLSAQQFAIMYG